MMFRRKKYIGTIINCSSWLFVWFFFHQLVPMPTMRFSYFPWVKRPWKAAWFNTFLQVNWIYWQAVYWWVNWLHCSYLLCAGSLGAVLIGACLIYKLIIAIANQRKINARIRLFIIQIALRLFSSLVPGEYCAWANLDTHYSNQTVKAAEWRMYLL